MSRNITIDRARLAEYLKQNAETLAAQADLRVEVDEESEDFSGGVVAYSATVRIWIEDIPLNEVEAI